MSQLIVTIFTIYCVFLALDLVIDVIQNFTKFSYLKKGIDYFQEKKKIKESPFFEDLVSNSDIFYSKNIAKVMRGREEYGLQVRKMHKTRNKRLWRNFKREKRNTKRIKKSLKKIKGAENVMVKEIDRFTTLSSYDYKVRNFRLNSKPSSIPT